MKNSLIPKNTFKKAKTYEDFLTATKDGLIYSNIFITNDDIRENNLNDLSKLDNLEIQKRILSCSKYIDTLFSSTNRPYHVKTLTILKSANILCKYYDNVKDLSNEEIALISYTSFTADDYYTSKYLMYLNDRELLDKVNSKSNDFYEKSDILLYLHTEIPEEDNLSLDEVGSVKREMNFILDRYSKDEILEKKKDYDIQLFSRVSL